MEEPPTHRLMVGVPGSGVAAVVGMILPHHTTRNHLRSQGTPQADSSKALDQGFGLELLLGRRRVLLDHI